MHFISKTRVQQVLYLSSQGESSKDIAYQLGLSESDVACIRQGIRIGRPRAESETPRAMPPGRAAHSEPLLPAFRLEEDPPPAAVAWCARCRCHVIPPCQYCRAKAYRRHQSLRVDAGGAAPATPQRARGLSARPQPQQLLRRLPEPRPGSVPSDRAELDQTAIADDPRLSQGVGELAIPSRLASYLAQHDILSVGQLLHCTPAWLLSLPNLGQRSLEQIYAALEQRGFYRYGSADGF